MIFGQTNEQFRRWRPWYAWRPVRLQDGRMAWLARVERRPASYVWPILLAPSWQYRLPGAD